MLYGCTQYNRIIKSLNKSKLDKKADNFISFGKGKGLKSSIEDGDE